MGHRESTRFDPMTENVAIDHRLPNSPDIRENHRADPIRSKLNFEFKGKLWVGHL